MLANHSWYAKHWKKGADDKLLLEQQYGGIKDCITHFYNLLPAFKDHRYIKVNGKPLFGVYDYESLPDSQSFINQFNKLAIENGFEGIYFVSICYDYKDSMTILRNGFDAAILDFAFTRRTLLSFLFLILHKFFRLPQFIDYVEYSTILADKVPVKKYILPCVIPNFDHSARSGRKGVIMLRSNPHNWGKLLDFMFKKIKGKDPEENIIFIRSWNEWGEGNYLEPDLQYGKEYLNEIKRAFARLE